MKKTLKLFLALGFVIFTSSILGAETTESLDEQIRMLLEGKEPAKNEVEKVEILPETPLEKMPTLANKEEEFLIEEEDEGEEPEEGEEDFDEDEDEEDEEEDLEEEGEL